MKIRNSHKTVPYFCLHKSLLHAVFVSLDHLLDHLAADRAGLTAGELAVITAFQVDADLLNVSDTS